MSDKAYNYYSMYYCSSSCTGCSKHICYTCLFKRKGITSLSTKSKTLVDNEVAINIEDTQKK